MKTKINVPVLFFTIGLINLIFLFDTILTDPKEEFSIFSLPTSKNLNMVYYIVFSAILICAGIVFLKTNNNKKKLNENTTNFRNDSA